MGNAHAVPNQVPPEGVLLFIQDTGCCVKPSWSHSKPYIFPSLTDGAWQGFDQSVGAAVAGLWSERYMLSLFVWVPLVAAIKFLLPVQFDNGLALIAFVLGMQLYTTRKNQQLDSNKWS